VTLARRLSEGLDLIARRSYKSLEIRLPNDSNSIAFGDELFRFAMLRTLLVASKLADVLITDHQDCCFLRHLFDDNYLGRLTTTMLAG
jgi:hypothetical protein